MARWVTVVAAVVLATLCIANRACAVSAADGEAATGQDASQTPAVGGSGDTAVTADTLKDDPNVKPSDNEATEKPKDTTPPKPAGPYERKLAEVDALVAEAEKVQEKVAKAETKVNEKIANMTDGAKRRVDTAQLREEIAEGHPTANARTYRDLTLQFAAAQQKLVTAYGKALGRCSKIDKLEAPDETLKVRAEALQASLKDKTIGALLKLASLYERVSETERVTLCYRQVLGIDEENSAAQSYFKELEAKKKAGNSDNGRRD